MSRAGASSNNGIPPLSKRPRTPEQQRRYEWVQRRNDAIQMAKLKQPKSGIFGHPPKDKS